MADSNITKNALAVSMKKLMEKKPFSKILSFPGQI